MFDSYDRKIEANGTFLAGYRQQNVCRSMMPSFLFTTLRVIRVLSGDAEWRIGATCRHIRRGDLVAVNNVELRQFVSASPDFVYDTYAFTPAVFSSHRLCLCFFYNRPDRFSPVFCPEDACHAKATLLLDMLTDLFLSDARTPETAILAASLITSVISLMMADRRECLEEQTVRRLSTAAVADTILYIHQHLTEDLSVKRLAERAAMSRGYFSAVFRRCTGIGLPGFVNGARAAHVVELLQSGAKRNVLDAALASGFDSSSGFYKSFKAVFGVPPLKYIGSFGEAGTT